jgi:hypothetical protein
MTPSQPRRWSASRQHGQHQHHLCRNSPSPVIATDGLDHVSGCVARRRACPRVSASPNVPVSYPRGIEISPSQATLNAHLQGFPQSNLTNSNRRPLLTMDVSERHARTRAITRDTVSPANRAGPDAEDASRDVAACRFRCVRFASARWCQPGQRHQAESVTTWGGSTGAPRSDQWFARHDRTARLRARARRVRRH